jgi:hypothetical protein
MRASASRAEQRQLPGETGERQWGRRPGVLFASLPCGRLSQVESWHRALADPAATRYAMAYASEVLAGRLPEPGEHTIE